LARPALPDQAVVNQTPLIAGLGPMGFHPSRRFDWQRHEGVLGPARPNWRSCGAAGNLAYAGRQTPAPYRPGLL